MGSAADYVCESCGYRASRVTRDFDYGFSADVVTPVVCHEHGIVTARTGLNAWDDGWESQKRGEYPCPKCDCLAPTWDGSSCPDCGQTAMRMDHHGPQVLWD
ncbi:hypothetical protein MINTM011_20480 [Mycobacterium paraintracellulare]|nr:hypothetical protein MINTM011_20480 [Mycobacterium paraintracellulare]